MRFLMTVAVTALSTSVAAASPYLSTCKETHCLTSSCATNPYAHPSTVHHHETVTVPVIVKKKTTPYTTITVTNTQITYTVVTTTTTLPQVTDTFSTTSTDTTIVTTDTTTTVTTTSTTNATTTVGPKISASSGFIPVFSGIAAAGGMPSKRKRDADRQRASVQERGVSLKTNKLGTHISPAHLYPKEVLCNTITKIYSQTTTTITYPTKTITAHGRATTTTTSTVTITETTIPGAASTTLSFSTAISLTQTVTSTSTSTTTTTTTTTSTDLAAAPTNEAWQANNIGRYFSSGKGFTGGMASHNFLGVQTTDSPEACCIQCVALGNACGGTVWDPDGDCFLFDSGGATCNPNNTVGTMGYHSGLWEQSVSNGNCAQFAFQGN